MLGDDGDDWAFGYWGVADDPHQVGRGALAWDVPAWRHAQDWRAGHPLAFDPARFALVDEDWAAALARD